MHGGTALTNPDQHYDAIMVKLADKRVVVMGADKTYANADAILMMAVARRHNDPEDTGEVTEYYKVVPTGAFKDGDKYAGPEEDDD